MTPSSPPHTNKDYAQDRGADNLKSSENLAIIYIESEREVTSPLKKFKRNRRPLPSVGERRSKWLQGEKC